MLIKLGLAWSIALCAVGALNMGGCNDVKNAYDCDQICNRYKECFDDTYDVDACTDKCRGHADNDTDYSNKAEDCQNCQDDASCAGAAFSCADECIGIVP